MFSLFKISDAQEQISKLKTQLADADNSLVESHAQVVDAMEKMLALSAKCDAQAALIESLQSKEADASEQAAAIVASVGAAEPVEVTREADAKSHDELWADYQALVDGNERNDFYALNRARMFRN